jgi:hypothetical protein
MAAREAISLDSVESSVDVGRNDSAHLVSGWHPLEHVPYPIRWTSEASEFLLRTAGRQTLCIEAVALGRRSVKGRVEMTGQRLGSFDIDDRGWRKLRFPLPAAGSRSSVQRGRIVTESPWSPASSGLGSDTRRLGIAVRRISAEQSTVARVRAVLRSSLARALGAVTRV